MVPCESSQYASSWVYRSIMEFHQGTFPSQWIQTVLVPLSVFLGQVGASAGPRGAIHHYTVLSTTTLPFSTYSEEHVWYGPQYVFIRRIRLGRKGQVLLCRTYNYVHYERAHPFLHM